MVTSIAVSDLEPADEGSTESERVLSVSMVEAACIEVGGSRVVTFQEAFIGIIVVNVSLGIEDTLLLGRIGLFLCLIESSSHSTGILSEQ